jgi:hypothetical protein
MGLGFGGGGGTPLSVATGLMYSERKINKALIHLAVVEHDRKHGRKQYYSCNRPWRPIWL